MNERLGILNGNMLKLLAMLTMTVDHVGLVLLNNYAPFRIIGRLAFPIFAFLIAEGCYYTKHKMRHFLEIFVLGVVCQTVYFIVMRDFYLNVLLTFSVSALLIYLLDGLQKGKVPKILFPFSLVATVVGCFLLERVGVQFDYGIFGILLPLFAYVGRTRMEKLVFFSLGLLILSFAMQGHQWWSLFALIPIFLYSGKRGRFKWKYLFYIFYPLHLGVIYGIDVLL